MEKTFHGHKFGVMPSKDLAVGILKTPFTTLGKKDPVSDLNRELWNAGAEGSPQRDQARKQKRKLNYYSNIYVVKDSANPSNEGKVFLYRFGKKIFDKIMESMQPAFEDETPVNPFDFWKGADFKLKITRVAGFWNYDKSEFAEPSTLGEFNDKELEAIWKEEHSLAAFTADDQFKSYEELKLRLESTLKGTTLNQLMKKSLKKRQKHQHQLLQQLPSEPPETDTLSYFAQLAKDD